MKKLLLISGIVLVFSCKKQPALIYNAETTTIEYGTKLSKKTDFSFRYWNDGSFYKEAITNTDTYIKTIDVSNWDGNYHLVTRIVNPIYFYTNIKTWVIINGDTVGTDQSDYYVSGVNRQIK